MASERDIAVAQTCLERGYATPAQVEECLKEASSASQTMRPVEAVLRHRGYISEEAYRELARSTRRCSACGTPYSGELCPRCLAGFAQSPSGSRAVPETTPRPAADPEIEKAAVDPKNRFGKFVLLGQLGAGGMGVVYKAWQTDLRRTVAIKFIRGLENERDLERFTREAQLAATLSHPGIAPIYESGEQDGKHYFAMQFVEGVTLDRLAARTPRPPFRRMVEILARAAEAVDYAHEQGIIHRDLKPQNVMVDAKDRAYVMDFGLAKSVRTGSSLTGSGLAVGTPAYMSPEQAASDPGRIDGRSDVYALGAILYQIGSGVPPFEGDNAVQVLMDVVNRDPAPPRRINPKFPTDLETIALKALDKDPARRYESAAAFAADLRRWLEGEPILARPAGTLTRLIRKVRKHKLATAGVLALALGLGIAAGTLAGGAMARSARDRAMPHYQVAQEAFEAADRIRLMPAAQVAHYKELLERAEKNARQALRHDEGFADGHFLLGRVLHLRIRNDEAEAQFGRAIELQEGHVRAYLERGLTRLEAFSQRYGIDTVSNRIGRKDPVLEFKPRDGRYHELRAGIVADLRASGRLGVREFEQALLEGAAEFVLWRPGEDARLVRAEAALSRAIALAPNETYSRFILSNVRLVRGDRAGAADLMAQAVGLAPNDRIMLYGAANAFLMAGRLEEAADAAGRALALDPGHPGVLNTRGNVRVAQGRHPEALEDFAAAVAADPKNPVPHSNAGYVHFASGRYDEALKAYSDALERSLAEPDYHEGRAMCLLNLKRFGEAEGAMDRVIAARPDADGYSNRGAVRSQADRFDEAAADYEQALRLSPRDPAVLYNMGINSSRRGDAAAAVLHFRATLEQGRDRWDTHWALAKELLKLGRHAEAEASATRALDGAGERGSVLHDRAQARLLQGKLDSALEDLLEAERLNPDRAGLLSDIGLAWAKKGEKSRAVPYLQRSLALNPQETTLMLLGEILLGLGRHAEAEAALAEVLDHKSGHLVALEYRALAREYQGNLAGALEDLERALAISDRPKLRLLQGTVLQKLKRHDEALGALDRAVAGAKELGANAAMAWYHRGLARQSLGRHREAAADFAEALKLVPGNPAVLGARARSLVQAGEGEEALRALEELLRRAPADSWTLWLRGEAHHLLKRYPEVLRDCEAALGLEPGSAVLRGLRGRALLELKRPREAAEDLRKAIELDPALKPGLQPLLDRALRESPSRDE